MLVSCFHSRLSKIQLLAQLVWLTPSKPVSSRAKVNIEDLQLICPADTLLTCSKERKEVQCQTSGHWLRLLQLWVCVYSDFLSNNTFILDSNDNAFNNTDNMALLSFTLCNDCEGARDAVGWTASILSRNLQNWNKSDIVSLSSVMKMDLISMKHEHIGQCRKV